MTRNFLSSALLLLATSSQVLGMCNPGGALSRENLMTAEEYDQLVIVWHRTTGINFTEAEPWKNFIDGFLISTEEFMDYELCWSEDEPVTAAVHMYHASDPTVNAIFAIYGSPDQLCAGNKLCRGAFGRYAFDTPESNFIFDCSMHGAPQADSCTTMVTATSADTTVDTPTSVPGPTSGITSIKSAAILGGCFLMTMLGMFV